MPPTFLCSGMAGLPEKGRSPWHGWVGSGGEMLREEKEEAEVEAPAHAWDSTPVTCLAFVSLLYLLPLVLIPLILSSLPPV